MIAREITFGAMEPKLAEQLLGFDLAAKRIELWQREADAITLLHLHGYIADSVAMIARKRLAANVNRSLK